MNTVTKPRVPWPSEMFWPAEQLSTSQETLRTMVWWLYYCYQLRSKRRRKPTNPVITQFKSTVCAFILQSPSWLPPSASAFSSPHCVSSLGQMVIQSVSLQSQACLSFLETTNRRRTNILHSGNNWQSQDDRNRWKAHRTSSYILGISKRNF